MKSAVLTVSLLPPPSLHRPPFVLVQAENDLNELRALMHSPNAIVVSSLCPNLNWAEWKPVREEVKLELLERYRGQGQQGPQVKQTCMAPERDLTPARFSVLVYTDRVKTPENGSQ